MLPAVAVQASLAFLLLSLSAVVYAYRDATSSGIRRRLATHLGALSAISGCMFILGAGVTGTIAMLTAGYGAISFTAILFSIAVGSVYAVLVHSRIREAALLFFTRS